MATESTIPARKAGTSIAGSWKKSPPEEMPNLALCCGPIRPKKMNATTASASSVTGSFQVTGFADTVCLRFLSACGVPGWGWKGFPGTGGVAVVLMLHLRRLLPSGTSRRVRPSSCAG